MTPARARGPARRQQGLTLFVAMIILVMITLLVVSAFRVSNTNLKIVASMQGRQEATASAQAAVEQVLSSSFFTENPDIVAQTPIDVDINGDSTIDYTVTMSKPACLRTAPVMVSSPPTKIELDCQGSSRYPGTTTPTWCSNTIWEVAGTTKDRITQAETTVRQGVGMMVEITNARSSCN
jgi:Tfp pilus assembly protein PilV